MMPDSKEELQQRLFVFELEMRAIAGTYVTTERFLTQFLDRAEQIYTAAPTAQRDWLSDQLSKMLAKFGFKIIEDDNQSE